MGSYLVAVLRGLSVMLSFIAVAVFTVLFWVGTVLACFIFFAMIFLRFI